MKSAKMYVYFPALGEPDRNMGSWEPKCLISIVNNSCQVLKPDECSKVAMNSPLYVRHAMVATVQEVQKELLLVVHSKFHMVVGDRLNCIFSFFHYVYSVVLPFSYFKCVCMSLHLSNNAEIKE